MSKFNIFLDSSALIAGAVSETGAAHVLLQIAESEDILLTVSEMVIVNRSGQLLRDPPATLNDLRKSLSKLRN